MKQIKVLLVSAFVVCNLFILISKAEATVPPSGTEAGISGKIGGVPTCHCPDDAASCYCVTKN